MAELLKRGDVTSILRAWAEATVPSQRERDEFAQLVDWARFYGLRMPVSGEEVATYLLEMMADGASLADIKRAANAIAACYAQRRTLSRSGAHKGGTQDS